MRWARLLGTGRDRAFVEGDAPLLLDGLTATVTSVLTAERAGPYLNVLYALLLLRRSHELQPLHDDLYRRVHPAQVSICESYEPDAFAQDLGQLEAWGCVERIVEILRIRGYRDNRREQFRYRLTQDAVALLEWLEQRLQARLEGRIADSRDRLTDVLGHIRETLRLLDLWRKGTQEPDQARRAIYLATAIDDTAGEIAEELLSFRMAMLAFVSRPYDLGTLREILSWLERYVNVYLAGVEKLRAEIDHRLGLLSQPRYRRALQECRQALLSERRATPRGLVGEGTTRTADELIDAQLPFFEPGGRLALLCARIDDSAREVLRKMHRHLRELERRSARLSDLRARIGELATLPGEPDPRIGELVRALVAAAHSRFDRRAPLAGERARPPEPRSHRSATPSGQTSRPLRPKRASAEAVRALRAKREQELGSWLAMRLPGGRGPFVLSELGLSSPEAARRWLDVARATHLASGRVLGRIGFRIDLVADALPATLGDEQVGLTAPDATIEVRSGEGSSE